jgi:microcompartment protein CcmK/EutM
VAAATGVHGIAAGSLVVGTTDTQGLTNKTLILPTIASTGWTNAGHAHTGVGSAGQLDHTLALTNIGTNSHATIDSHIAAATGVHGITGSVVGTTDAQNLSNKTLFLPTINATTGWSSAQHAHAASGSGGQIDHANLSNVLANQHHNQSHVLATNTALGTDHTISGAASGQVLMATAATAANFQQLSHTLLSNVGTNTHVQLDSHLAASTGVHGITGSVVGTTDTQNLSAKTLILPTIASTGWTNANHSHLAASGGGLLTSAAVSLGNVTNDSQLKRSANDFNTFSVKSVLSNSDVLIIEDSAAGGAKKYTTIASLPSGASGGMTAHDLNGVYHTTTGGVAGQFVRINSAATGAQYQAITFNKTINIQNPATGNITIWRVPQACTIAASGVWAHSEGGSGCTFNLNRVGTSQVFASNQTINATGWTAFNPASGDLSIGRELEVVIATVSGAVTELALQVDYTYDP